MARQLVVELVGRSDQFTKSLDAAGSKAESFSHKLGAVGTKMTKFVTLPILAAGAAAFKTGSDLAESMNAADVAFEKDSQAVKKWAKDLNSAFGFSERAALDAAASFRLVTKNTTITSEQITDLTERAADLGSVFNASADEVSAAIKSALVGETEPMRRFGVVLNETRLKAEALLLGLAKAPVDMEKVQARTVAVTSAQIAYNKALEKYGADSPEVTLASQKLELAQAKLDGAMKGGKITLDAAAKAAASYSLIMKDTAFAQDDATNTADTAAGKMRVLKTELSRTSEEIGTKLIPAFLSVTEKLQGILSWLENTGIGADKLVFAMLGLAAVGPILKGIELATKAVAAAQWAWNTAVAANPLVVFTAAVVGLAFWLDRVHGSFGSGISTLTSWDNTLDEIGSRVSHLMDLLRGLGDRIRNLPGSGVLKSIGTLGGKLPFFHDGGVVPGPPGANVPIMAQAGETVIPNGRRASGGGGGVVINVAGSVITERDLGRIVADALRNNALIGVS